MKSKLIKVLSVICTTCYGIIGFWDFGDFISLLYFGEPDFPKKPEE